MARDTQPIDTAFKLDQYQLLDRIAEGGMGQVFKARHVRMQRDVAVKIITEELLRSPEAVQRFQQEVRSAAQLSHPNIAAAYDAGEQSGVHYLVLEYVDGPDLATVVSRHGSLTVPAALDYVRQAAEGLKYAHSKGILHRDIKPANLLLDSSGVVKISDLGLAFTTAVDMRLTQSGQQLGTSAFMAPEQAEDLRRADARSDIYALGCTLFNLLVGRPPYRGATDMAVAIAHREEPIPSLRKERPDVPAAVDEIFRKMVAKRPQDRFASMDDVLNALRTCTLPGKMTPQPNVDQFAETAAFVGDFDTAAGFAPKFDTVVEPRRMRKAPQRSSKRIAFIALAVLATVAAVAGIMLSLKTPHGNLTIASDDPNVKIAVKQGGKLVEIIDAADQWKVSLKEGKYELEVRGGQDDLQLEQGEVVIRHGQETRLKVTLQPQVAAAAIPQQSPPVAAPLAVPQPVPPKPSPQPEPNPLPPSPSPHDSTAVKVPVLKDVHELIGLRDEPYAIAFSPDGKELASCGRSGHVVMWNTATGAVVRQYRLPFPGEGAAYSPDGKTVAFVGERFGAAIVKRDTGKPIHTLSHISPEEERALLAKSGIYPTFVCVAFSPDGKKLVTGSNLNDVVVWDVTTGEELARLKIHTSAINGIAYSPNGRQFVSASHDGTLQLWNAETYERLHRLRHDRETSVFDVLFSPDSAFVYSVGNAGNVIAWDAETGAEAGVLKGDGPPIMSVSYSADAKFLVTASYDDRTVRFWDPAAMQIRSVLRSGPFQPIRVRCSPSDPTLIAFATPGQSVLRLVRYVGDKPGEVGNVRKLADGKFVVHQEIAADHLQMPPWQSFKAPVGGTLTRVELQPSLAGGTPVELKIYEGTGTDGKAIYSQSCTIPVVGENEWRSFDLTEPPMVNEDGIYTVELIGAGGMFHSKVDSYPDGRSINPNLDMTFRLHFQAKQ